MKTKLFVAIIALLTATASIEAGLWERVKVLCGLESQPKAPTIKVLVGKDLEGAMLEVKGKYNLYDPYKDERISSRFFGKSKYIQPVTEGLKWGESFPGVYQLMIVPDHPNTTTVVNGIEYRGTLLVYQTGDTIQIVNEVPVEDYVHSILAVQCDAPSSSELLSAMAIALRTDACYDVVNDLEAVWHVDADKVGYTGYAVTKRDALIKEVMGNTRHLVLSNTRAYQGRLTPIQTACLDSEFGRASRWNRDKAIALANKGADAAKILSAMYPQASVEMMTTLEQGQACPMDKQETTREVAEVQPGETDFIDDSANMGS